MTIRVILAPIDGTDESKPALETAVAISAAFGAHVEALHVRTDPKESIPLLGEGMSVAMIEDMVHIAEAEAEEKGKNARAHFDDCLSERGIAVTSDPETAGASAEWREEWGRDDDVVARYGRLADLIVAPQPTGESDVSLTLALNAALFDTGRPVLVVPPGGGNAMGRKVAISWNGSAQSARAVGSALPFLKNAEDTTVFSVESPRTQSSKSREVSEYLGWHGLRCSTREIVGSGGTVGAELMNEIEKAAIDLLVMGAYTHSRVRQLILGGVTRHVLENAKLPVLMAH